MIELYEHQRKLVEKKPEKHGIFFDRGCGKTITAIALANAHENVKSVIVVCPKGLKTNWKRNLDEHMRSDITFEVLSKEEFRKYADKLPKYDVFIGDESHYLCGMTSQLTKAVEAYFKKHNIKYRYLLTGTPMTSDVWSIYRHGVLLDKYSSKDYWNFRTKFFTEIKMGVGPRAKKIPKQRANIENDIKKILQSMGTTLLMEDIVDIPDQVYEEVYFDLTDEQIDGFSMIDDVLPITRLTKEHQVCGGTLKGDGYVEDQMFKSDKLDYVLDLTNSVDKMIVVCRYRSELEYVGSELNKLGITNFIINGDTSGPDRQKIIDICEELDRYVLLVSSSISEGWELSNCRTMVFYSHDFSFKNKIQMEARIRRINNLQKNLYLSLVVKDTIDEAIFKKLKKREDFHLHLYNKDDTL